MGSFPSIHKFGGAALADAPAIRHAASLVAHSASSPAVIVTSALAGTTDMLLEVASRAAAGERDAVRRSIDGARQRHVEVAEALLRPGTLAPVATAIAEWFAELESIVAGLDALRELTPRTLDRVAARGERLAARLFAAALVEAGTRAQFVDATEILFTDGRFGAGSPDLRRTATAARRALAPLLRDGVVPVVPGFIGAGTDGDVVTLGRGGSDLTATVLGRVLGAREVVLWKDVPGLMTADPRVVPDARVLPQLSVKEAAELAYYGAKVLHPRALIPLAKRTRVHIRPFTDSTAAGTEISHRLTLERYPVKALSAIRDQALVNISGNGMLGRAGIAGRAFTALEQESISVSLISQASSEHSICFAIPAPVAERARACLAQAFASEIARGEIDEVDAQIDVATIAVVGAGMAGTPGIAARVFSAVARGSINVIAIAQGSSEFNISLVVDAADVPEALRRIHAEFQLSKIGGGQVAAAKRADVILLGFGRIGQTLAAQIRDAKGDARLVRIVGVIDRSGFIFNARGLSRQLLRAVGDAKQKGGSIANLPGSRAADPAAAIPWLAGHALSTPVLVDVTAADTGGVLHSALEHGMHVVLANKRPLAGPQEAADALFRVADAKQRRLLFEATVGAGLPIIDTHRKLVEAGDRVSSITGCPSGTLGYLFGELGSGQRFSEALRCAIALGYTEPDPRDDLSGMDVARKALILARLIGYRGELENVEVESLVPQALRDVPLTEFLDRLEELDAEWEERVRRATERGTTLRYTVKVTRRSVAVGVVPVPLTSGLAALRGTDNQFAFTTARYKTNPLVITGPGAGAAITAAGLLNDVLKLAREAP